MELAPGIQVTGNVRLVQPLGEGGMGSVWIAEHSSLHTRVAVKFISKELLAEEPRMAERFAREASMSAQIKSPYVVQTFDHGMMADGRPYIVMELLEGESLDDRIERGVLPLELVKTVINQTAKALGKAHKLGIVHRDIKPDNLFLTYEDDELFVKVLDFGVAKRTNLPKAESVTGTGMMVGTPHYMSPEQVLSAKSVDHKSDLWALAVVAYHCLTGATPFNGETLGSLCVAIAGGQFAKPSSLRPELSPAVDDWFARALNVDPELRFSSAKELAQAFTLALTGERIWNVTGDFSGPGQSLPGTQADWSGPQPALGSAATAPGGNASPTFAGTTMSPTATRGKKAIAGVVGLLAVVAGVTLGVTFLGDDPGPATGSTSEPTSAKPAAAPKRPAAEPTSSVSAEPSATATAEATASPEPSASASADASASASASATATAGPVPTTPGTLPKPVPSHAPPPPPPPTVIDRGF